MWKRFRFVKICWRLKCCWWEVRTRQSMLLLHKTNRWYYWEEVQYHPWRFLECACISCWAIGSSWRSFGGCSAIDGHLWVAPKLCSPPWGDLCILRKFQSLKFTFTLFHSLTSTKVWCTGHFIAVGGWALNMGKVPYKDASKSCLCAICGIIHGLEHLHPTPANTPFH
jgi:hypothetical protein